MNPLTRTRWHSKDEPDKVDELEREGEHEEEVVALASGKRGERRE